jgi:hypothetical protein
MTSLNLLGTGSADIDADDAALYFGASWVGDA